MPGLYTLVATRTDGETLTAAKYNGDGQNHIDNQELQKTDDFSISVGQMQTATDPGEVGTESLATDASGEIARLRFAIKETKDALGTAVAQWYTTPPTIGGLIATQNTRNLAINGDMEDWRNGTAVAPFGWTLSGVGASVARDGTNFKTGTFAASVTRVTNDALLQRDVIAEAGGQAYIRSRAYRFSAWVRATVAGRVRLRVNDGVGSTFSSYHTGGGAFERLSVTRTLDSLATALNIGLSVDTGDTTGQIDTLMLTEGAAEVAFTLRGETSLFRQVFTGGGTYTKPSNLIAARVVVQGPGGDGGSRATAGTGAGGGSGAYSESILNASDIGATETVTVPAGGSGTTASFGALVTAPAGGNGGNGPTAAAAGTAGAAGTGQIALSGTEGQAGRLVTIGGGETLGGGGYGAPSPFGGGGPGVIGANVTVSGQSAGGKGAGGGGCFSISGAASGGLGSAGIVIVHEILVV